MSSSRRSAPNSVRLSHALYLLPCKKFKILAFSFFYRESIFFLDLFPFP